ncbi:U-box domain-containing protein 14 [Aristolochia californica]|uniref:U-box domain-containing protein 14 n=1 Tax=Aristolochia californica TaxID=171875 RepID=UPI0035DEF017
MEVKRQAARSLVQRLSSESERIRTDATCELRLLSKHDPDSRLFIAEAGAVPLLVQSLYSVEANAQENAVATLFNISISHREPLMSMPVLVDALGHVLRHPKSPSAAQTAAATLHSLLVVDAYRPIIGSKPHLLTPLIHLIQYSDSPTRSIKDGLKALFGVSLYPLNRSRLVELGVVPPLFNLVVKDSRIGIVEDSTAVIAQVAGCYESVEAFRQVAGVKVLVDLLDVSTGSTIRVKENAVSALLNLLQCGGVDAGEDVREMGFAWDGILEVAETGSAKAKTRANDLLNLIGERERRFGTYPASSPS